MSSTNRQFNEYAEIYDELFSAAMDYEKEVEFHDKILRKHNCRKVLEVGCGTGHRGKFFINKGYDYTGLDISEGMLIIARRKYPEIRFIQGDARKLQLNDKFDAIIFVGKGSAYLTTDEDVISALKSMRKHASKVIIIDGFDADFIIPNFKKNISWSKQIGGRTITRQSVNILNPKYHNAWDRQLTYIVKDEGEKEKKYTDSALLRAFFGKELKQFFAAADIADTQVIHNGDTVTAIGPV